MDYDFSKLTNQHEWLICYQGWRVGQTYPDGSVWPQPSKRAVKKLIERGLMTAYDRQVDGLIVTEYDVPIDVHYAWCMTCEEPRTTTPFTNQPKQQEA